MLNSNYTGRVPRNLQSAFGPYTDSIVFEMQQKKTTHPFIAWFKRLIGLSE